MRHTANYVLLERIGIGGMAEVYRAAVHGAEGFERPVAIKRILPNLAMDDDFVKMFVDEAKIAVQLQHPNIVQIFDLGREDDELFIAMEFVHGKDLRAVLDRSKELNEATPVGISVYVTMKMCEALHHAHFAHGSSGEPLGIIHRDVSPQNVMLSYDGEVKVTDFGLAKAAGRAVQTQAGVVKGKLAYMSPEQLRGQTLDQRSDVYGVGILFWEMLTGTRLFLGKNDQETLRKVYAGQVPSVRQIVPELHPDLDAICQRALAKDLAHRYETAEQFYDDLSAFMYAVGPVVSSQGISDYMHHLYPQAAPVPPPPVPNTRSNLVLDELEEVETADDEAQGRLASDLFTTEVRRDRGPSTQPARTRQQGTSTSETQPTLAPRPREAPPERDDVETQRPRAPTEHERETRPAPSERRSEHSRSGLAAPRVPNEWSNATADDLVKNPFSPGTPPEDEDLFDDDEVTQFDVDRRPKR